MQGISSLISNVLHQHAAQKATVLSREKQAEKKSMYLLKNEKIP